MENRIGNKIFIIKQEYVKNGIWKIYLKECYSGLNYFYHKGKIKFTGKCWIIELKKWWKEWEHLTEKQKMYLTSPWLTKSMIIKNKKNYIDGVNGWFLKNKEKEQQEKWKMEIKIYKKKIKKLKKLIFKDVNGK